MLRPLVLSIACLLAAAPARAQVSYVESSFGLAEPGLEGGRTELAFGDVDGDGHPDLVSVGDHGNPGVNSDQHGILVWFGNGAGAWSLSMGGNFGYGGVALGDVNGDGLLDVGYGIHHNYSGTDLGNQLLEVALGDGTGLTWQPWDDGLATAGESWGMFGTDFADVDNDGDLDIGSVSFGSGAGLHVYRNNGDGSWTHAFGFLGGNSSMIFVFGDVDGDGNADFATSHGAGTVYRGDGSGGFTLSDTGLPAGSWRNGVDLGDIDADGREDLAFATSAGAAVYRWQDGSWVNRSGELAGIGGGVALTQIADMDGDGFGDVVALAEDHTRVYLGDGAGHWTLAATVPTDAACGVEALNAGWDVDHNGRADFAYVTEEDCQIFVGGTNALHLFREATAPGAAVILPVAPRGGEVWVAGSTRFVDWHAAVPSGSPSVTIELSTAGPAGPWALVGEGVPDNGRFQWKVPASTPPSTACHLRLTLHSDPPVSAVTPASFTIRSGSAASAGGDVPPARDMLRAAPNPFLARTRFLLHLLRPAEDAALTVHDPSGRLLRRIQLGSLATGSHSIVWDGRAGDGRAAAAGAYLARVQSGGEVLANSRVVLVR